MAATSGTPPRSARSPNILWYRRIHWSRSIDTSRWCPPRTLFGSCNPKSDIPRLAGLYEAGLLRLDEMVTRRYRLDEINDAYADLLAGELIRGVIDFSIG